MQMLSTPVRLNLIMEFIYVESGNGGMIGRSGAAEKIHEIHIAPTSLL